MSAEETLNTPHDRFFKESFTRLELARGFLQRSLPEEITQAIDWETLHLADKDFLDEALRRREGDLLFEARWGDQAIFFYLLLEHRSYPDRWQALTILRYLVGSWTNWRKAHPKENYLPMILPIVFFQNTGGWPHPRSLRGLLRLPENLQNDPHLAACIPDFSFDLIDVHQARQQPRYQSWKHHFLLNLFAEAFAVPEEKRLFHLFGYLNAKELSETDDLAFLRAAITYIYHISGKVDKTTFLKQIELISSPKTKESSMTFAQQLHEEGREEGREEGIIKTRREAILENLGVRMGVVPSGLQEAVESINDAAKLKSLMRRSLTCTSTEDFAQGL
jgi:predicted transposase YdaD